MSTPISCTDNDKVSSFFGLTQDSIRAVFTGHTQDKPEAVLQHLPRLDDQMLFRLVATTVSFASLTPSATTQRQSISCEG